DVQLRHDLQARGDAGGQLHRYFRNLLEQAVDAQAHAVFGFVGLEMDGGCAAPDRVDQRLVDELDDRRVVALGVHTAFADFVLATTDIELVEVFGIAHGLGQRVGGSEPLFDHAVDLV